MTDGRNQGDNGTVVEIRKQGGWSELWRTEDCWAIWLAFSLIIVSAFLYRPDALKKIIEEISWANTAMHAERAKAPFKTVGWYEASEAKSAVSYGNMVTIPEVCHQLHFRFSCFFNYVHCVR